MSQKAQERELWQRYKNGDKGAARELYERMRPLIASQAVNRYRFGNVPLAAIEAEAREWFLKALDEYDPSRGAELSTYLVTRLRRVGRFVERYKNVARIPEGGSRIRLYQEAKSHLEMVLGREPSAQEIAEDLKWEVRDVANVERSLRRDLSAFGLTQAGGGDDAEELDDRKVNDAVWFLYYSLKGEEKTIMEYLLGWAGKPKLKAKEIAQRMGISEAKVSRVRTRIAKEFERHYH